MNGFDLDIGCQAEPRCSQLYISIPLKLLYVNFVHASRSDLSLILKVWPLDAAEWFLQR